MAIVINGDGTITGVSAGGLPADTVTLANMAAGTDGQMITYDASGDPVAVGPGTDGQVLTSTGAGSPPAFEAAAAGGSWNIIGTSVASSSATLSQTGLSSTYDCYAIVFSDLVPATDGQNLCIRVGDSSGYDSGGSDYTKFRTNQSEAANTFAAQNSTGADHIELSGDTGSAAGEGIGGIVYILRPGDGTTQPLLHGFTTGVASDGNTRVNYVGGMRQAVITLDRVQVFFTSGNIATGRMTVYGIAHA